MATDDPRKPRRRADPRDEPRDPDHVDEGTGKQFARGTPDDRVRDPADPTDPRHATTQAAGSGKQFARGIGEDEAERADATVERPVTDPREPDHTDKGTGKQFAAGVGEDPATEHPPTGPGEGTGKQYRRDAAKDKRPAD
jgi:hypothetical protein